MKKYLQSVHQVKTRRQRGRGRSSVFVSITTSQTTGQEYLVGISIRRNGSTLMTDLQIARAISPERAWLKGYALAQAWVHKYVHNDVGLFVDGCDVSSRRMAA
ncbi:MAG TPA: hypothetical protein VKN18_28485 [Blastocatellia bacterium]|nr:hypothetical protein [Blastocatellia bacterium]